MPKIKSTDKFKGDRPSNSLLNYFREIAKSNKDDTHQNNVETNVSQKLFTFVILTNTIIKLTNIIIKLITFADRIINIGRGKCQ